MLGLSNGITSISAPSSRVLLETYTADWSSGVDGWESSDTNDAVATLTGNVDDPFGTGKNNCLKVEFNADETGTCGFRKNDAFSTTMLQGDVIEITCNIYLESTYDSTGDGSNDVTDRWTGTDVVTSVLQMPGAATDHFFVTQDQWVALDTASATNTAGIAEDFVAYATNDQIVFLWNQASTVDSPKDGARVYVHNLVAKLYRSQLFT